MSPLRQDDDNSHAMPPVRRVRAKTAITQDKQTQKIHSSRHNFLCSAVQPLRVPSEQNCSANSRIIWQPRHYGMSRSVGIEGASTTDRALSRAGAARDLNFLDSSSMVERFAVNEDAAGSSPAYPAISADFRESVAKGFVLSFLFAIASPGLLALILIVDWVGVWETIIRIVFRIFDFS